MKIITVANLKGGSGKTTTAAYLAHAYAATGLTVMAIDADPQGSLLRWSESGEWLITTIGLPVKDLHKRLPGLVQATTDIVIIDTPPLDDKTGVTYSALRAGDIVVIPMAPTIAEYERLEDVIAAVDETESMREIPAVTTVLLNRTIANATSTGAIRNAITSAGHHVLAATIPRRESIAQAFASTIDDPGAYAEAAKEIKELDNG